MKEILYVCLVAVCAVVLAHAGVAVLHLELEHRRQVEAAYNDELIQKVIAMRAKHDIR